MTTEIKSIEDVLIDNIKKALDEQMYLTNTKEWYSLEIIANYDDEFDNERIAKILNSKHPIETFNEMIMDCYFNFESDLLGEIENTIFDELSEIYSDNFVEEYRDFIKDYLLENIEIIYPYSHYLNQNIDVDIICDTGDGNYDYTLTSVYPHYDGRIDNTIDDLCPLVWLTKQQGYSKTDLNNALKHSDFKDSKLLKSLYQEVINCTTHMNALTFFASMTLEECINLNEQINKVKAENEEYKYHPNKIKDRGYIVLDKNVSCGLYDNWNGAGSVLEIELEKDVKLPIKYISTALPDGCRGYGVKNIYGMSGSFWKEFYKERK